MHSPQCAVGKELFAALVQAQQQEQMVAGETREEAWEDVEHARDAYINHVYGWRQGDGRVHREEGGWKLEKREQERWVIRSVFREEETLQAWLKAQGFWRYAQLADGTLQDRFTGYYHQRALLGDQVERHLVSDATTIDARTQTVSSFQPDYPSQAHLAMERSLRPELELKTQLALLIAVLVGRHRQPLTPVESLSIQRKAIEWALSQDVQQINASDVKVIGALIEEAHRFQEVLPQEETER